MAIDGAIHFYLEMFNAPCLAIVKRVGQRLYGKRFTVVRKHSNAPTYFKLAPLYHLCGAPSPDPCPLPPFPKTFAPYLYVNGMHPNLFLWMYISYIFLLTYHIYIYIINGVNINNAASRVWQGNRGLVWREKCVGSEEGMNAFLQEKSTTSSHGCLCVIHGFCMSAC